MVETSSVFPKREDLKYNHGFNNHFETEVLEGALPHAKNSPQKCPYSLIAEQFSGTPFTYARAKNQRSWLYRIRPSAQHPPHQPHTTGNPQFISDFTDKANAKASPLQYRWKPIQKIEEGEVTFWQGIKTMMGAGEPSLKDGIGIHHYSCNKSMTNEVFFSSDGDLMVVPQEGALLINTEMGRLHVEPLEIVILPRGLKFSVLLPDGFSKGYLNEVYKGHYILPDLGPIGSNCLANPRDFEAPVAWYEDKKENFTIVNKFIGDFFTYEIDHSPFDIVAWHGNYYPYKYDLRKFNTVGSISYDHPDPSIFTVLTCQTDDHGQAVCDLAIFPPRWLVAEDTFKPPFYHRNTMSEYMGNIAGVYDAKEEGFCPGSSSLHSTMQGHGPEADVLVKASNAPSKPMYIGKDSMAFMFESCYMFKLTNHALDKANQDTDYYKCWEDIPRLFNKDQKDVSDVTYSK